MEKRPPTENVVHLLGPMTRCFAIAQTQWRGEEAGLNRELIGPKIFFPGAAGVGHFSTSSLAHAK